jgi:hypothetical protein
MIIFNQGERIIQFEGGELLPKKSAKVDDAVGAKLVALFGDELQNIETITETFNAAAEAIEEAPAKEEVVGTKSKTKTKN